MKFIHFEQINSTNSYCKEHIDELDDKTIVYTSHQTQGRGRFNRIWVDLGHENIYMSFVLKPSNELNTIYSNLTQYTSLVLAKLLATYNIKPKIKWPNDILINKKKISGILAETTFKNNKLSGIIIGVGINLNARENDFNKIDKKVTSLNIETKCNIDAKKFLQQFVNNFFFNYDEFLKKGFPFIKIDYENYIDFLGKEITINNLNNKISGKAEKITKSGALVINGIEFYTGDII